jgi:endonuclease/exonuclease/phosphatase (EEP) superfamily protein YafD
MASVLLVIVQAVLVLPSWHPWATAAAPAAGWRLRVFDANVRFNNLNLTGIGHEINVNHPDLVSVEELSFANERSLLATGAVARFKYRYVRPADDSTGFGVWSDEPLTSSETWNAFGHTEYSGMLHPPSGGPISLLVVHTFAPYGAGEPSEWQGEMASISARVADAPRPLIVTGDFNATTDMKQFRSVLHHGLTDAAVSMGDGWRMTWPRNWHLVPPLVRPDHVLYSDGLTVTSYRLGDGSGSDHRPLEIVVARAG